MNTPEEKKKIMHKKLTRRNIAKRALFITIGAIIMAYGPGHITRHRTYIAAFRDWSCDHSNGK